MEELNREVRGCAVVARVSCGGGSRACARLTQPQALPASRFYSDALSRVLPQPAALWPW